MVCSECGPAHRDKEADGKVYSYRAASYKPKWVQTATIICDRPHGKESKIFLQAAFKAPFREQAVRGRLQCNGWCVRNILSRRVPSFKAAGRVQGNCG